MTRRRCRSARAYGAAPRNYRHNTMLVAALTPAGLHAPMALAGPLDGNAFAASVQHVLVPTLQPGPVVIRDNLSVHNRADILHWIEQALAALVFLPAYSPDFTPIEQAFSKLKTVLRRIQARTQEALEAATAEALATISATDAVHWFRHAGYHFNGQLL